MRYALAIVAAGIALPVAAQAQQAQATPDQIICAVTDSCGGTAPSVSQRLKAGDEKAFSLALPTSGGGGAAQPTPPARPVAGAATRSRHQTAAMRPMRRAGPALKAADGSVNMLLTFGLGSAQMTPAARTQARAFATALASPQLSGMRFTIEGHTDNIGSREYNVDLSQRRAQTVVDFLVQQGVDRGRLEPRGFGFDKPLPGTTSASPANRRVALVKGG